MATKKPLKIGDTAPIEQFGATDTIPPANIQNGIPAGGTTGQVLEKISGTDYNTQWATPSGGGASYLVYTALLTQSGTSAPVATVLENTLGGSVVWTYDSPGTYTATLSGAFTANKTWTHLENLNWDGNISNLLQYVNTNSCRIVISAGDDFLGVGNEAQVEIRVYS